MLTEGDIELIVRAYGDGMQMGADRVLDLIEEGVPVEDLRQQATRRIVRTRAEFKAGLEAGERFESSRAKYPIDGP
jgi:hypothetical protein